MEGGTLAKNSITIKDVAREAKVSVATVSRALNGHDNVAEAVRKAVLEVADRLRYSPHAAARSLSSRHTQTIGVVLPDLYGEFFSELIRGIDGVARARRQHLLVSSYHGDQEEQGRALRAMRGRVDGLLVLSPYAEHPGFLTENLPQSLPTVLINTHLPDDDHYPVLSIDDHAGAIAMTEHLLAQGHRRIVFVAGPELNFDARERLRGFQDAMAAHGADARARVMYGDFDEASGYRAGQQLLQGELPDAVFAANDMMALGCLYALTQAGVQVPGQVALAGFDDIPLARFVHPGLTTMRVSIAELGAQAMSRLLGLIDPAGAAPQGNVMLKPTLIVRDSTVAGAGQA